MAIAALVKTWKNVCPNSRTTDSTIKSKENFVKDINTSLNAKTAMPLIVHVTLTMRIEDLRTEAIDERSFSAWAFPASRPMARGTPTRAMVEITPARDTLLEIKPSIDALSEPGINLARRNQNK